MESSILGYINKAHFWWERSCTIVLSVVSRSSVGKIREGIREVKEWAILIKVLFLSFGGLGCSLVRLWFVLGLLPEGNREGTRERNLKNCALLSLTSLPSWVGEACGNIVGVVAIEASGGGGEIVVSSRFGAKHTIAHLNHIQIDL